MLLGIRHILIHLYSQFIVSQLNGIYCVCNPNLLQKYIWVKLWEFNFECITYIRISRGQNRVANAFPNYELDWDPNHQSNESNHT